MRPPPVFQGGWSRLSDLKRSVLFQNALALYAIQAASFLLPFVTLPYLARVLRPEGWGLVVFAQGFSVWLGLMLQYGFSFSGTREVARRRGSPSEVAAAVAGVQGAKAVLAVVSVAVAIAAWAFIDVFRADPRYLLWAWVGAVCQGFNPVWYFQGVERLREPALVDVGSRAVAAIAVFLLVRSPEHGWIVLALRAGSEFTATSILTAWMYRTAAPVALGIRSALSTLRSGVRLFAFSSASSLYTTANSFIIGLMAIPREVSAFGAADRLVRAASSLLVPISQALYPRLSHLFAHDEPRAGSLIRRAFAIFVGLGIAMGIGLFVAAPALTGIVFGPGYEDAIVVVRVLALLPPLLGVGTVLGVQWALPVGLDGPFSRMVITAGLVNVVLAVVLVPRYGAVGMASAAVIAEGTVDVGLVLLAIRHGWSFRGARGYAPAPAGPGGNAVAPIAAATRLESDPPGLPPGLAPLRAARKSRDRP